MRLTEIKLAGFKSFVDPVVIPVPGNLVGIVGPNGCGKSNVIDAIRWVLGESRASALRGESLQDVIFNGSATRKPVGRASVELVFDNSSGKAAGQWKAYNEIAIKRIMQKEGESTYYINNIHVRRRDVTDMFLGTGISGRGYAIIEQGMISRIIEAKPQELRAFLEEAAGISKYRERRHETGLRLTDARSNLLRLDDILEELERQSQHLEAQGEVATRYQNLHKQLTAAQHALWSLRKQEAAASRHEAQKEIEQLTQELEIIQTDLQETDEKLNELRIQHRIANERQHLVQGELYAADGEIARIGQDIRHMRENREQLDHQTAETALRLQDQERQLNEITDNMVSWQSELEQASERHNSCKKAHTLETSKLPSIELTAQSDQTQLSGLREKLALVKQNEKLQQNQLAYAERALQQLILRRQRRLEEQYEQPAIDLAQLEELSGESEELAALTEQTRRLLCEQEARLGAVQQERDELLQVVHSLQRDVAQAKAQHDVLQRLQNQIESNQDLSVWMARNRLDLLPRLWQQIGVEAGWETALEAVLRERIQAVTVDQLEQVLDWEAQRPPAKWSVCELRSSEQLIKNVTLDQRAWKPLIVLLDCRNQALWSVLEIWLHGVFVIDDIRSGLADRQLLAPGEVLVTAEGHSLTRYSISYFAPDSVLHGVLSRQQEIDRLTDECEKTEQSLLSRERILAEVEQNCGEVRAAIVQMREEAERLKTMQHDRQIQIVQLTQQNERLAQQQQHLETELAELAVQIEEESSQKHLAETGLAACEAERVDLEEQVQKMEAICQASGQILVFQRSLVQRLSDELREAIFNEQNYQNRIADCEQRIGMITGNQQVLTQTLNKLKHARTDLEESSLIASMAQWQVQHDRHEQALAAVRHELETIDSILLEAEQTRLQLEHRLHECREAVGHARLKEQEAGMTEIQFADKLAELRGEDHLEMPQQSVTEQPARLQARIKRLSGDIAALGAVNLGALQELQALQSRQIYLEEQSSDLREAVLALEQAIRQIDRETRERLLETFHQVNGNLAELFASIFGGGSAELVLNGEDILDAGVQLNAHPPGKRNSSIHLLSGGEKALTALALVFSLFKLNPAPFCLLDEVDAPLDDSNSVRFCDLVKRMAEETQFLFISHNKITMQMAEQLIGVTMREQGVSRVVTVDVGKMIVAEDRI